MLVVWFLVLIVVLFVVLFLYWKERSLRQRQVEELRRERYIQQLREEQREAQNAWLQEKLRAEQIARQQEQIALQQREAQLRAEQIVLQQREARQYSLRVGSYYSTIEQVWEARAIPFDEYNFLTDMQRSATPTFVARGVGDEKSIYKETLVYARALHTEATDDQSSSRTSHSSTGEKLQIWPQDIFGGAPGGSEIAHLVPASPNQAAQYFDVARCTLGIDYNGVASNWESLQKAIHGAREVNKSRRIKYTGIKHFVSNKIRLFQQGEYLDRNPCLLIIPVMNLTEVKSWDGEGYRALVLPGNHDNITAHSVCQGIRMTEEGPTACEDEIETARELLGKVLQGLAYSRKHNFSKADFTESQQREADALPACSAFKNGVQVPVKPPDPPLALRVRMVQFAHHDCTTGHPAPDPLLLAVRAAVIWSWRNNQKLLAAGEIPEEDEFDILAHEQYLMWRDHSHRPKSWDDLARGLHQQNGYDETKVDSVAFFEQEEKHSF